MECCRNTQEGFGTVRGRKKEVFYRCNIVEGSKIIKFYALFWVERYLTEIDEQRELMYFCFLFIYSGEVQLVYKMTLEMGRQV